VVSSIEKLAGIMNTIETQEINKRSDGAKRMWKRRKEEKEGTMENVKKNGVMAPWIYQGQWWTLMCGLAGSFVFFFTAFSQMNHRLDDQIKLAAQMNADINKRVDEASNQLNSRCDSISKEFYDLLKEVRDRK
jgi:hypothetical protein